MQSGKDYTISYSNNINRGTGKIILTGKGNYKDSISKTFNISRKTINTVWGNTQFIFNNREQLPTASVNTGVAGETITLSVVGAKTNVGTYTATASMKSISGGQGSLDNYTLGNTTVTFEISPRTVTDGVVRIDPTTFLYDGNYKTPSVSITVAGRALINGIDFKVSYSENKESGVGKVYVKGIGNYKDTYKIEFLIYVLSKEIDVTNLQTANPETGVAAGGDQVGPVIIKDGQLDNQGYWATSNAWSKTKDFVIKAKDTGTQISRIKFQNVNSFRDQYGITSRNTGVTPHVDSRDYKFTGDVNNFVNATIHLVDDIGNKSTEHLRIYNLDNTKPIIKITNLTSNNMVENEDVKVNLKDTGSGIRYFGIVPITQSTEPANVSNVDTLRGTELNTWYRVNNTAATDPSNVNTRDINITFKKMRTGKYYFWAKDLVGNSTRILFEAKNRPLTLIPTHSLDRNWYEAMTNVNLDINVLAEEYEIFDPTERGKDVIVKMYITDENNQSIIIPNGMKVIVDENEITPKDNRYYYVLEPNLNEQKFEVLNKIKIMMKDVHPEDYFKTGDYTINFEYYVGKGDKLERKVRDYKILWKIDKYRAYSLVARAWDINANLGKTLLEIDQNSVQNTKITLRYIGDLEGPKVIIKLQKLINSNGIKQYQDMSNVLTSSSEYFTDDKKITINIKENQLEKGNYRLKFELKDKYDETKATEVLPIIKK